MRAGERRPGREGGFTYLGLLFLVVLIGLLLARAGVVTRAAIQREHEGELLRIGHEYRAAIGRYFVHYQRYPTTLVELVGPAPADGSAAAGPDVLPFRAMRRLYRDPMTNSMNWTLVPAPDGSIMGVASPSTGSPFKVKGFELVDEDFDQAKSYAEWKFAFDPSFRAIHGTQHRAT